MRNDLVIDWMSVFNVTLSVSASILAFRVAMSPSEVWMVASKLAFSLAVTLTIWPMRVCKAFNAFTRASISVFAFAWAVVSSGSEAFTDTPSEAAKAGTTAAAIMTTEAAMEIAYIFLLLILLEVFI